MNHHIRKTRNDIRLSKERGIAVELINTGIRQAELSVPLHIFFM